MERTTISRVSDLPITLEELQLWCRIDEIENEELLLEGLILAARDAAEAFTGRCLTACVFEYTFNTIHGRVYFPESVQNRLYLPDGPISTITNVEIEDRFGARSPLIEGEDYLLRINDTASYIRLLRGFSAPTVVLRATAGYPDTESIPQPIKQAIAVHAASAYRGREGQDQAHETFERLLRPYMLGVL